MRVRNEVWQDGALVSVDEVEVPDAPSMPERLAALETEVRGVRERAAAAAQNVASTDARAVGKAVAGPDAPTT